MSLCKLASPAFDPNSELAETIKVSARVHQSLIWTRQRQANQLRSMLREFYPAALAALADPDGRDALGRARGRAYPATGCALSVDAIVDLLREAGRCRYLTTSAERSTMPCARAFCNTEADRRGLRCSDPRFGVDHY